MRLIMDRICSAGFFILLLSFFVATTTCLASRNLASGGCIEGERQSLLNIKKSFTDYYHRLSSWKGKDCCSWYGVSCQNTTGHVLKLDLRATNVIRGSKFVSNELEATTLVSDILGLKYLNYLDLSGNNFQLGEIPVFIGSLKHLRYLNLSSAIFSGIIPAELGNLTSLQVLDLHDMQRRLHLTSSDLSWVSSLSSLERIDLSGTDLYGLRNSLIKVLSSLPSLLEIKLSGCLLNDTHISPPAHVSNTLSHVQYLNLSYNSFEGKFPSFIQHMTSLRALDLSQNSFNSLVPQYLGTTFKNLTHLNLRSNTFDNIEGGISTILGNICHLKFVDLSLNDFHGEIVQLDGNLSARCIAYDLEFLALSSNYFTGHLPQRFLGKLKNLRVLRLRDNLFSGSIPASLGGLSALTELILVSNQFTGVIPSSLGNLSALKILDLYANNLTGSIPSSIGRLSALTELDVSFNQLSGGIPVSIGTLSSVRSLFLGFNRLNGPIPTSLGLLSKLERLDISFNSLGGVVSEVHFAKTSMLNNIDARSNTKLIFKMSLNWIPPFQLIHFLAGSCKVGPQFPQWLQGQNRLVTLNLTDSGISGSLPSWLRGSPVTILLASDNEITGPLSNLPSGISRVDLSRNNISERLFSNFPSNITDLYLSHNRITGGIPRNIGDLTLFSLDLSRNSLSGAIPPSITTLSLLQLFNVSYNNLSGRIPTGNNIQVLSDPSAYAGNPGLCGAPLPRKCPN